VVSLVVVSVLSVVVSVVSLVVVVPAGSAAAAGLSLRVVGSGLVDGAGAPVVLRGVNVSGTEFACIQGGTPSSRGWSIYGGQPLADPATFRAVAGWRANAVRVPLNEDCWLGINGVNPVFGGASYRAAIAAEVAAIHAAGLYAVLDLHWSAPGSFAAYGQQSMADAEHSPAFWSSVATAFKDDPAVVFDLFNEPFFYYIAPGGPDQWTCWLRGCTQTTVLTHGQVGPDGQSTPYQVDHTWQSAGMQQLVDAVRRTGATQPVIAKGVDWGNDLAGWASHRPVDPQGQLIAGWHSYPGQPCAVSSCWDSVIAPLAAQVPVLVGETGDSSAGTQTYLPSFLPWADSQNLSYFAWTWNVWDHPSNVLIRDWNGTPTTGQGTYYRNHLLGQPAPLPSTGVPSPTPTGSPSASPSPSPSPSPTACPCSLWPTSTVPAGTDPDTNAVELGVKIRPARAGSITAVRFHKSRANTGRHSVRVWTSSGTLLARATATSETASGWQTVRLASPVRVTAGATYVVSYHAPYGRSSADGGYFASAGRTSGPLTAPASSTVGGNGVYAYGPAGSFPRSTYNSSNYWVDAVFR
jgi:hypothetical protein